LIPAQPENVKPTITNIDVLGSNYDASQLDRITSTGENFCMRKVKIDRYSLPLILGNLSGYPIVQPETHLRCSNHRPRGHSRSCDCLADKITQTKIKTHFGVHYHQ